ncbi:MAG: dTMP kinase [Planctomycetes bacterium]|nr:dTMP kinase [Planctomycetota bacterium]
MSMDANVVADQCRGKFLVFDGPDGAGKSSQRQLLADALEGAGVPVVSCRDPGGTEIGDRIRSVLLDFDLTTMDVKCEALLFMASRAQLVAQVVKPALDEGKTVLCDRFITSTCAYQGAAGYDPRRVIDLARFAVGDCWPDVTIILDVDAEEGFQRIGRKPHHAGKNRRKTGSQASLFKDVGPDAMEARSLEFHRRVRQIFLQLHEYYPTPVVVIDGRGDHDAVHERVLEGLARVTS